MLWHYRALWLFGVILALAGANTIYPGAWLDRENNDQWIKIKITDAATIQLPGADVTLDHTAPDGVRSITEDGASWREFRDRVDLLNREVSVNLWPILIEFAVILASSLLLGVAAR